jgi:alpha-tubulin suppressor-like RCC1 family protein
VAAGEEDSCAIANGGRIYCWGTNTSSALGGVGGASSSSPVLVQGPGSTGGFVEVVAGSRYACARHGNGEVWCWGENTRGQLGAGDTGIRSSPNRVTLPRPAVRISARYAISCALLDDATLWCWGSNGEGEMGQDDPMPWTDG